MHPDDVLIQVPGRTIDPMTGIDDGTSTSDPAAPSHQDTQTRDPGSTGFPSTRFTIRIPGAPMNYAAALKRTVDQAGNEDPDSPNGNREDDATAADPVAPELGPCKLGPGPVAGFTTNRLLENLDPTVRKAWEEEAIRGGIFVHYLDGGYTPDVANNAGVIEDDLKDLYKKRHPEAGEISPAVTHPTAAIPDLRNRYAPPFIFLVTGLPEDFRDQLVEEGVWFVDSHLAVLFVERGVPIPHDYVVTLTNYNMRTETSELEEQAISTVRESVVNRLFDVPTDTSARVKAFIRLYHDNIRDGLSEEQALNFVRESIRVEIIKVVIPGGTKTLTPIYGVYIHPPTAVPDLLKRWRQWIEGQKYHAGRYGVGIKYQFAFKCIHCKSIDHPGGLCHWTRARREGPRTTIPPPVEDLLLAEELLPVDSGRPQAGPSRQSGGGNDTKGKGRAGTPAIGGRTNLGPNRPPTARGTGLKKRRFN